MTKTSVKISNLADRLRNILDIFLKMAIPQNSTKKQAGINLMIPARVRTEALRGTPVCDNQFFLAAQGLGLQGLQAAFVALQGLQAPQAFFAAHGLHTFFAAQALQAFLGAQAATAAGTTVEAAMDAIAAAVKTSLNMGLSWFVH